MGVRRLGNRTGCSPRETALRTFLPTILGIALCVLSPFAHAAEVRVEVEHANRIVPMMEIARRDGASGGLCVAVGEGAGRAKSPGPGATGSATFWVHVPEKATYRTWVRSLWIGGCSNSVNLSVDGGFEQTMADRIFDRWHWVRGPHLVLDAGPHLLVLSNREDGILLDQFLLTTARTEPAEGRATQVPAAPALGRLPALQPTLSGVGNIIERVAPLYGEGVEKDPIVHSAFVAPGAAHTDAVLWLRNNTAEPVAGKVVVEGAEGASVTAADPTWRIAPNGLTGIALRIAMPKGARRLAVPVTLRIRPETLDAPNPVRLVVHALPAWRKAGPVDGARPADAYDRADAALQKEAAWTPFDPANSFDAYGRFDLNAAFSAETYATGFARMRLVSDAARSVDCYLAHDDHMVVWVNGQAVYSADYVGPASDSRRRASLPLQAGRNDILIAVGQEEREWHFSFIPVPPRDADVTLAE